MEGSKEDESTLKLFKARRTVWQMLRDRGYVVADEDVNMVYEEFVEKYGKEVVTSPEKREELTIFTKMRDERTMTQNDIGGGGGDDGANAAGAVGDAPENNGDMMHDLEGTDSSRRIFVFFPIDQKIGLNLIQLHVTKMMQENVKRYGMSSLSALRETHESHFGNENGNDASRRPPPPPPPPPHMYDHVCICTSAQRMVR